MQYFKANPNLLLILVSIILVFNAACSGLIGSGDLDISQTYKPKITGELSEEDIRKLRENAQHEPGLYADYLFASMFMDKDPAINLLGKGLAKLPDLNDDITYNEVKSMESIIKLAKKDDEVRDILKKMAEKKAAWTKYSPFLQSILWLADGKEISKEILKRYSKKELVNYAYNQLASRLRTPKDIYNFTTTNFSYVSDRSEYKKDLKEIFIDKGGNCEYTSGFECEFLKKLGYDAKLLVMLGTNFSAYKGAHVICYYGEGEKIFTIETSRNILRIAISRKPENQRKILEDQMGYSPTKFNGIIGPFNSLNELLHHYNATHYLIINSYNEYQKISPIWRYETVKLQFEKVIY